MGEFIVKEWGYERGFKAGQVDALEFFLYKSGAVTKRALKKKLREIKKGGA